MAQPLIKIENLHKYFPTTTGFFSRTSSPVQAVRQVSLEINQGETLGLVGESGCGKSTIGKCLLGLLDATKGTIFYRGENITHKKDLKTFRRKMQIIFQDPYSSLNPRMTIGQIIAEPLVIHKLCDSQKDRLDRVKQLLETVGLHHDARHRYPYEFSGGQRQRIGIARALAVNPEFIVCDEPVSALDVSIQAQIINLLMNLQQKLGLTYLFIAHDLKLVKHISHQVAVMYLGQIVEIANSLDLYQNPQHPYTKALMSAIPRMQPQTVPQQKLVLKGDLPSPIHPPKGCCFHTRCPIAASECQKHRPDFVKIKDSHQAACLKLNGITFKRDEPH